MHTRDCSLTGMGGHGCGRKSRLADTGVGWSSSKHATDTWSAEQVYMATIELLCALCAIYTCLHIQSYIGNPNTSKHWMDLPESFLKI